MTKLILEPSQLRQKFPRAAQHRPERVRLVVQIYSYNQNDDVVVVQPLPITLYDNNHRHDHDFGVTKTNLTDDLNDSKGNSRKGETDTKKGNKLYTIKIADVLEDLYPGTLQSGNLLNIEAFYDGKQINAFSLTLIRDMDSVVKLFEVLKYMSEIKPLRI